MGVRQGLKGDALGNMQLTGQEEDDHRFIIISFLNLLMMC